MGKIKTHSKIVKQAEALLKRSLLNETRQALIEFGHLPGCYAFLIDNVCVYIGRGSELSSRPLTSVRKRLAGRNAEIVLMPTQSKADSYVQEIALIIHYKPAMNVASCPNDQLTFSIPLPKAVYRGFLYEKEPAEQD